MHTVGLIAACSRPLACGKDAQKIFAIAGRGFGARISTESSCPLTDSVYSGNCIGVCPTSVMCRADTICPYCGAGWTLHLSVQENKMLKVTPPLEHDVTSAHPCIKGRVGCHVEHRAQETTAEAFEITPVGGSEKC